MQQDRPTALRHAITVCRKGGTLSVPGVYAGMADKFPMGTIFGKGLTVKTGQTHVQKYVRPLMERIARGDFDPSYIVTHRMTLDEAPTGYDLFRNKQDECIKIVLKPGMNRGNARLPM
jgi:threonine dehydrogenase-like Zn-dependent dehydrogenase